MADPDIQLCVNGEEKHEGLFLHQIIWDNSGSTVTVRLVHPPETCSKPVLF